MTSCDIMISLKKEYADLVLKGEKTVELRRRPIIVQPGSKVWVYSTLPVGKVQFAVIAEELISGHPDEIWTEYRESIQISQKEFNAYVDGCQSVYALKLGYVIQVKPLTLAVLRGAVEDFHPPQFFKKIKPGKLLCLLESSLPTTYQTDIMEK